MRWFYLLLLVLAQPAFASCRQALALGLDVSHSVGIKEYRLQLAGVGHALSDPRLRRLILSDRQNPIAIFIYEWGDQQDQAVISDWVLIRSAKDLDAIQARLETHQRGLKRGLTATANALGFAREAFLRAPSCPRQTIDISSDGRANSGPAPREVTQSGFARITVNALVVQPADVKLNISQRLIIHEQRALVAYFEREVIHGAQSFVIAAKGYEDFARAMTEKLIREISPVHLTARAPRKKFDTFAR